MKLDFKTLVCFFTLVTFIICKDFDDYEYDVRYEDYEDYTWECNGTDQRTNESCNRQCPADRCWSGDGLSCEEVPDGQYSCGGKCQLLSIPCNGLCSKNRYSSNYVLIGNICEVSWNTWECNGKRQRLNETCNRQCHEDKCFSGDGLSCEEAPYGQYSCGGKCQSWNIPCNRQCPADRCLIEEGLSCEWIPDGYYSCGGKCQLYSTPCNRQCPIDRCLSDDGLGCEEAQGQYSCGGKCQSLSTPCEGLCRSDMVLIDNICEESWKTWECNGKHQLLSMPCEGLCSKIVLIELRKKRELKCEKEFIEFGFDNCDEYVKCGDKCQLLSTPCDGLCREGFVVIDNICVLSQKTWECNGTVQQLNEPCNRQCPENRCWSGDGLSCEEVPYGHYSCGGKCLSYSIPCEGLCSDDMVLIIKNNICESSEKTWDCNGTVQYRNEPCNRHCPTDKCLSAGGLSCEWAPYGQYSCGGKCQYLSTPCEGRCSKERCLSEDGLSCEWDPGGYYSCRGTCQSMKSPCNRQCPEDRCLSEDGLSCKWAPDGYYWLYSCGGKCHSLSTPCEGLCRSGRVLIDYICEESWNTWECNGTIHRLDKKCNGQCHEDRCLSIDGLSCEEVPDGQYSCGDKCQSLSTPCEGLCSDGRVFIVKNNICEESWNTWECNGTIQRSNETCNRQCHENRCLSGDGLSCEEVPDGQYSCGGKCQSLSTPCEGLCSDGRVLIVKDNICEESWNTWDCNGTIQRLSETYNKHCHEDRCWSEDELSCEVTPDGYYSCENKCQLLSTPCNGLCSENRYGSNYVLIGNICEGSWNTWECNGKRQLVSTLCEGLCRSGMVLIDNICEWSGNTRECNGKRQRLNETCNRQCHEDRCLSHDGLSCEEPPDGYYSCGNKCQLLSTPCDGLCSKDQYGSDYLFINNVCEKSWECNGKHQLLATPCDGLCKKNSDIRGKDMVLIDKDNVCEEYWKTWECNGKHQLLSTPCEELCSNDMVLIDSICEESWKTWECNGTFQRANETCNNQCPKDRCLAHSNSCKLAPYGYYSCGDKCQFWSEPCNGQCLIGLDLFDGSCYEFGKLQQLKIWECDGKQQLLKSPCNGECPSNLTLVKRRCLTEDEFWVCDNVKQPIGTPCYGLCSYITERNYFDKTKGIYLTDYVNVENECLLREHTSECNGVNISKKKPCDGKCRKHNFYFFFGECIDIKQKYIWISKDGEFRYECPSTFEERVSLGKKLFALSAVTSLSVSIVPQIISEPGFLLHLTSSSDDHPKTSMGVYQKTKVIHNRSPVYYHTKGAYYIFVDREGFWTVSNRIGFEPSTLYRNSIKPIPEQPPVSGWRYRESTVKIFQSDSIGRDWQEDPGLKLVLKVAVSSKINQCPPKYCRRGDICCPLGFGGPNVGYICPPNC